MEKEGKKVKERDEINKKVFKTCLMSFFLADNIAKE